MNGKRIRLCRCRATTAFLIVAAIRLIFAAPSTPFTFSGDGISIAVAGVPTLFRITSRDVNSTVRNIKQKLITSISGDAENRQRELFPEDDLETNFFGSYKITRAGNYHMSIIRYACK